MSFQTIVGPCITNAQQPNIMRTVVCLDLRKKVERILVDMKISRKCSNKFIVAVIQKKLDESQSADMKQIEILSNNIFFYR